ncbi:MAG: DUF6573 family protein [Elusimicrobiota bacterium]
METETGWEDVEVIHAYTRKDAMDDGVLVDLSGLAREAGFRWPLAVTRAVYEMLEPSEELKARGQSVTGRAWDMLFILRVAARRGDGQEISFSPLFLNKPGEPPEHKGLRAVTGPGDDGEPVITVMLPGED